MLKTAKTLSGISEYVDWEKLKDVYAILMMSEPDSYERNQLLQQPRRRLSVSYLKKSKVYPSIDHSTVTMTPNIKKKKRTSLKSSESSKSSKTSKSHSSLSQRQENSVPMSFHSVSSKSSKSSKSDSSTAQRQKKSVSPAPSGNAMKEGPTQPTSTSKSSIKSTKSVENSYTKSQQNSRPIGSSSESRKSAKSSVNKSKSSKVLKKCKKVKISNDILQDHRRLKKAKKTKVYVYNNVSGSSSKTSDEVIDPVYSKSMGKGKRESDDSTERAKSPKSPKSATAEYKLICEGDYSEMPSNTPTLSAHPTMPRNAPPTMPPIAPSPVPIALPTVTPNNIPTTSSPTNIPSSTPSSVESSAPSTTKIPSSLPTTFLTSRPSVSIQPTKAGTTRNPSQQPTLSHHPSSGPTPQESNQPSSFPSTKPSQTGTSSPTTSVQPTLERIYRYDSGSCPNAGIRNVPCAEPGLRRICNRYDEEGSFRRCWELCKPSFCCIHDAENNFEAISCSDDENCAQYAYCYIVWFHFHDTLGPATNLHITQEGVDFFDVNDDEVNGNDKFGNDFFDELFFHHFDDVSEIIQEGTVNNVFEPERIFNDEKFWEIGTTSAPTPA